METVHEEGEPESTDSKAAYSAFVESLRASEARYRELFENANDLVFTMDFEGRFTSLNRAVEETTGFSRDELVGSDLSLIVPPQHVGRVHEMMRRKIATNERTRYEIEIVAKDGRSVPIEVYSRLVYENDKPVAIQGIARDISERKLVEEQLKNTVSELERSNQELQQFAGVASHDMHAPLRRIVDFAGLVQAKKADSLDMEGREWIGHIVSCARQMQQLIDDLLAHSRVGASSKSPEMIDCEWVVRNVTGNLADAIQESGAELRIGQLPTVMADRVELVRLFQNLIGNAIKYRGTTRPLVEITADRCEDVWQFRVKDNGIGIAEEDHERIFEAFRRLHSDDEYAGTGIGLATCKKVVERLGGRIWVKSTKAQGTEFFFTLPITCP
jgi:PAS domain S-box-containing protein